MKRKDLNSLRTKNIQELEKFLNEKRTEIMKVRVRTKVSKEKNLKHVKMLKRDISQVYTILTEKRLIEKDSKREEKSEEEVK